MTSSQFRPPIWFGRQFSSWWVNVCSPWCQAQWYTSDRCPTAYMNSLLFMWGVYSVCDRRSDFSPNPLLGWTLETPSVIDQPLPPTSWITHTAYLQCDLSHRVRPTGLNLDNGCRGHCATFDHIVIRLHYKAEFRRIKTGMILASCPRLLIDSHFQGGCGTTAWYRFSCKLEVGQGDLLVGFP